MPVTPLYRQLKKNGTTLYVLPGVAEDKNFENQNETYKMQITHFALVNFPRQVIGSKLDPEVAFTQNGTSIAPVSFKDQLVESLRNYVANHEATIRNSKINANTFYYDTFEPATTAEKIFWKWCKKLGVIDFEPADPTLEYFGTDPKYNDKGATGNTDHYREYLWRERNNTNIYDATAVTMSLPGSPVPVPPPPPVGFQYVTITFTASTTFKPGDIIYLNNNNSTTLGNLTNPITLPVNVRQVVLEVVAVSTNVSLNDEIVVAVNSAANIGDFGIITDIEVQSTYQRFVQLIGEITGINNVQLPDRAYTETHAYVSYQHGQIPYALWNIKDDNNYKPNSVWPILPSEIQGEIQGGQVPTNPILTNPTLYPGDIWAHFDIGNTYTTETGDAIRRHGNYYGNNALNNISPTLKYPDFDGDTVDGLTLNLNINDYAKAVSYTFPIESFNEFCATAFNNEAPKDFKYNAILWFYTIEDVSGNQTRSATNLYGVEFLDNPDNDYDNDKTLIPEVTKLVSNGYQDGNAYTWSLDLNYAIDSDVEPPTFDPDKVYSLFGMELFYEALMRLTYFNDQLTNLIASNVQMQQTVQSLQGLVYTQQNLEAIRSRMDNIEALLNVYSTLQIGKSSTIEPELDTSVSPPVVRLNSVDKQYGFIHTFNARDMFTEYQNISGYTTINATDVKIPVKNGKDFLVVVNNNDYNVPTPQYDPTIVLPPLSLTLEKDLDFKQKIDILIIPKAEAILNGEPINDKKLNLYINFNDGTQVIKQQLGLFDLPTLKFISGVNWVDQPNVGLKTIPSWKTNHVYYSAPTASDRVFSFIVEDDMLANNTTFPFIGNRAPVGSKMFIKNLFIENVPATPSGLFRDMTGQYDVYATNYEQSPAIMAEINDAGNGYVASSIGYYTLDFIGLGAPTEIILKITTNAAGKLASVEVLNNINNTPAFYDYNTPTLVGTLTYVSGTNLSLGGTGSITLKSKIKTRIDVKLNFATDASLNTFLTQYDVLTQANANLGMYYAIDQYMKTMPELSYLNGWKISIVRITDTTNVPITQLQQRYNINVKLLNE